MAPKRGRSESGHVKVDEDISDYELVRLKNIQQRNSKFDELNIITLKTEVSATNKRIVSKRGLSAQTSENTSQSHEPVRKSLRLQKIDADTGLSLPEKEPTKYFTDELENRERLPLTELELQDLSDDFERIGAYLEKLKPVIRNSKDSHTGSRDTSVLKKALKSLKISPEQVAKVTPDRIFSLAIHPTEDKLLVAAGGKWGTIGFWDVLDTTSSMHGVETFKHHSRPVNCLTFDNYDSTRLVSTSYDGTVRIFDINAQRSSVLFAFPEEDSNAYTTYHSQIDQHSFLVTMGRSGTIGLVDTRKSNQKPSTTIKVFEKCSPKMVHIHPLKKEMFVTPSSKGECGIFDMRNSGKKPVMWLEGHTKALSSAFFSPLTGNQVLTVAYDNKVRIFDTEKMTKNCRPRLSINHNNQTGRWLTTFKAEWHPNNEELFFVGSMSSPRQIDMYTNSGEHMCFKGEDLASICSIVKCHPSLNVVVGGNSSGRVHVFK